MQHSQLILNINFLSLALIQHSKSCYRCAIDFNNLLIQCQVIRIQIHLRRIIIFKFKVNIIILFELIVNDIGLLKLMMTPFVLIHRQLVLRIDVPFEKLHELLAENIIFLPHVQKHNYLIQSHIIVFSEVKSQTGAPLFHFVANCADVCEIVYFNILMLDFVTRFLD